MGLAAAGLMTPTQTLKPLPPEVSPSSFQTKSTKIQVEHLTNPTRKPVNTQTKEIFITAELDISTGNLLVVVSNDTHTS